MMYVIKKLGCSELIGKTVVGYLLGQLADPAAWAMWGVDIAITVGGALSGGAAVFIKKAMEMGLKAAVKKLVAKEGMKAAISF